MPKAHFDDELRRRESDSSISLHLIYRKHKGTNFLNPYSKGVVHLHFAGYTNEHLRKNLRSDSAHICCQSHLLCSWKRTILRISRQLRWGNRYEFRYDEVAVKATGEMDWVIGFPYWSKGNPRSTIMLSETYPPFDETNRSLASPQPISTYPAISIPLLVCVPNR